MAGSAISGSQKRQIRTEQARILPCRTGYAVASREKRGALKRPAAHGRMRAHPRECFRRKLAGDAANTIWWQFDAECRISPPECGRKQLTTVLFGFRGMEHSGIVLNKDRPLFGRGTKRSFGLGIDSPTSEAACRWYGSGESIHLHVCRFRGLRPYIRAPAALRFYRRSPLEFRSGGMNVRLLAGSLFDDLLTPDQLDCYYLL